MGSLLTLRLLIRLRLLKVFGLVLGLGTLFLSLIITRSVIACTMPMTIVLVLGLLFRLWAEITRLVNHILFSHFSEDGVGLSVLLSEILLVVTLTIYDGDVGIRSHLANSHSFFFGDFDQFSYILIYHSKDWARLWKGMDGAIAPSELTPHA